MSCASVVDLDSADELEAEEPIYSDLTVDEKLKICRPSNADDDSSVREGYLLMQYGYGRWIRRYLRLTPCELFILPKAFSKISKRIVPLCKLLDVQSSGSKLELVVQVDRPLPLVFKADDSHQQSADTAALWRDSIIKLIDPPVEPIGFQEEEQLGWAKVQGKSQKYLFSLNKRRAFVAYYLTAEDYDAGVQVHRLSLRTCLLKPGAGRASSVDLVSASARLTLTFEDAEKAERFKETVENAIRCEWNNEETSSAQPSAAAPTDAANATDASSLTMSSILSNAANRECADCGAAGPLWASINLLVTLCDNCSGQHRQLSTDFSKVHSLKHDVRVWQPELVELFVRLGNSAANRFWYGAEKPPTSRDFGNNSQERLDHIVRKYVRKAWVDREQPEADSQADRLDAAMRAVQLGRKEAAEELSGADPLCRRLLELNLRAGGGGVLLSDDCIYNGEQLLLCLRDKGSLCLYTRQFSVKCKIDCKELQFLQKSDSYLQLAAAGKAYQLAVKSVADWWPHLCRLALGYSVDSPGLRRLSIVAKAKVQTCEHGDEELDSVLLFGGERMCLPQAGAGPADLGEGFDLRRAASAYVQEDAGKKFLVLGLAKLNLRILPFGPCAANELLAFVQRCQACGPTLQEQPLDSQDVPLLVSTCLNFVGNHGLEVQGVYRVSGSQRQVADLLARYRSAPLEFCLAYSGDQDVHNAVGLLKMFLRQLDEPPVPKELLGELVEAASHQKWKRCRRLLRKMDKVSYSFLRCVVRHMAVVARYASANGMTLDNLAIVFAQWLAASELPQEAADMNRLGLTLLTNCQQLMDIDDKELQQEADMYEQAKRIQRISDTREDTGAASARSGGMLVSVYYGQDDGVLSVKVDSLDTIGDMVQQICQQHASKLGHPADAASCSMFETLETQPPEDAELAKELAAGGFATQMERLADKKEVVRSILNRWKAWSDQGLQYYVARMRFRLRHYAAGAEWPAMYKDPNILVEQKFVTQIKAEYLPHGKKSAGLGDTVACYVTLDDSQLNVMRSGVLAGIGSLAGIGNSAPASLHVAQHHLFYGCDLRRLGSRDRVGRRGRCFTLVPMHAGAGGDSVGCYLGHTFVLPTPQDLRAMLTMAARNSAAVVAN